MQLDMELFTIVESGRIDDGTLSEDFLSCFCGDLSGFCSLYGWSRWLLYVELSLFYLYTWVVLWLILLKKVVDVIVVS